MGAMCPKPIFMKWGKAGGIRNALAICAELMRLPLKRLRHPHSARRRRNRMRAHGVLLLPAPATAAILEGMPLAEPRMGGERCTPTSAALIKHLKELQGIALAKARGQNTRNTSRWLAYSASPAFARLEPQRRRRCECPCAVVRRSARTWCAATKHRATVQPGKPVVRDVIAWKGRLV